MEIKNNIQQNRWRDATRRYEARQNIKTFWNEVNDARETPISRETQEYIQRTLIESIGSAQSISELENKLTEQGMILSRYTIERLMMKIANLTSCILEYLDRVLGPMIQVVEADETFHGDSTMFFEAVDHRTGYVLALNLIPDAKSQTLLPHYEELLQRFPQISTFITDLAPAYPTTIEQLRHKYNKELTHLKCQVHALRAIYKEINPFKRKYSSICDSIRSLKTRLHTLQTNVRKTKKSKYHYEVKFRDLNIERDRLQKLYNVKKYSKNIWMKYPALKVLNTKINTIRSVLRGKQSSILNLESKIFESESELARLKKEQPKCWNLYMNSLKMKRRFVSYCKHRISTLKEFEKSIRGFKQKPCRKFKKTLMKFVQSHPELMSLHQYLEEEESLVSLISTNKIESFNNVLRRYKDVRRCWQDTETTTAYLNILRLYMNFRRPLRGKGKLVSPIERFGVDLKGKSLYDLLFCRTEVNIFDVVNVEFELSLSCGSSIVVRS